MRAYEFLTETTADEHIIQNMGDALFDFYIKERESILGRYAIFVSRPNEGSPSILILGP
jgi:hypothetical protein